MCRFGVWFIYGPEEAFSIFLEKTPDVLTSFHVDFNFNSNVKRQPSNSTFDFNFNINLQLKLQHVEKTKNDLSYIILRSTYHTYLPARRGPAFPGHDRVRVHRDVLLLLPPLGLHPDLLHDRETLAQEVDQLAGLNRRRYVRHVAKMPFFSKKIKKKIKLIKIEKKRKRERPNVSIFFTPSLPRRPPANPQTANNTPHIK